MVRKGSGVGGVQGLCVYVKVVVLVWEKRKSHTPSITGKKHAAIKSCNIETEEQGSVRHARAQRVGTGVERSHPAPLFCRRKAKNEKQASPSGQNSWLCTSFLSRWFRLLWLCCSCDYFSADGSASFSICSSTHLPICHATISISHQPTHGCGCIIPPPTPPVAPAAGCAG